MKEPLYILFGWLLTFATSLSLGLVLFRALKIRLHRLEHQLLAFMTGSVLLSGCIFLFCITSLVRKGVFLALAAAAIGAAWRLGAFRGEGPPLPPIPRRWKWVIGIVFGAFTVLYFFNAMAPEFSPDGSAYHLVFIESYREVHGFVRIPSNYYANLTQGMELLFLYAFMFGKHSSAALVHFSFLAATPWLMICYGRRFGLTAAGIAGGLFFFGSPVVGIDGSSAYVDVALAAVLFALFYLLQIWDAERDARLLIPIGLLAGFSVEIKYTALLAIPYAVGFVAYKLWRSRAPMLRPIAVTAAIAFACIAPWLIKNALWMDNPVTPFANRLFPNPYVHASFEKEYAQYQRIYTLTSYKQIPLEVTVKGALLCGFFGPLFLLIPLSLLALRRPAGRQLLLAGVIFALPYAANIGTRFLIPAAPFLSIALAMAAMNWEALLIAAVLLHAVLSWPAIAKRYCSEYAWHLQSVPVLQALRIESEDAYLTRTSPSYRCNRELDKFVPADGKVFSFGDIPKSHTRREVLVRYLCARNEVLSDIVWTVIFPELQPQRYAEFRFPPRSVHKLRVVRTKATPDQIWGLSEVRVYNNGLELPRDPAWRLTAQPNPWDVQLAFDNSPVTRWRSWQDSEAGMFVEIDFGRQQSIDAVRLETEESKAPVRIEALDASGRWLPLSDQPAYSDHPIRYSLRRAAMSELKRQGIRYLLIGYDDPGSVDFQQHRSFWGLRLLTEVDAKRLYYIE